MKTTTGLSWKSLVSKIHPPLPMTPRESQRLVTLLDSSFKQQLDRQHAAESLRNKNDTDIHLNSILTNPLFQSQPQVTVSKLISGVDSSSGLIQDVMKRPSAFFREHVAAGTASIELAELCLQVPYQKHRASGNRIPVAEIQDSKLASVILEWLWSSGLEDSGAFLKRHRFLDLLVRIMVITREHARVQRWLKQLSSETNTETNTETLKVPRVQDRLEYTDLLEMLVRNETLYGAGLQSAIELFQHSIRNGRLSDALTRKKFIGRKAAWSLTTQIILPSIRAGVSDDIVKEFLNACKDLYSPSSLIFAYHSAYLAVPPDPMPALLYFRRLSANSQLKFGPREHTRRSLLGLKAAELFLNKGAESEAVWLMDFLQTYFGTEIGSVRKSPSTEEADETESLHILDTLAIPQI